MAKYTTEVRTICESKAGLEESKGGNNVDAILNECWNKIFTTNCTFFDETYRPVLCKKILKHYYRREIGAETAGLWQLWMNTKLEEIMPYYNKLYESELIEFNPMNNVNLTKTGNNAGTETGTDTGALQRANQSSDGGTRTTAATGSGSTSDNGSSERDIDTTEQRDLDRNVHNRDAYSDTPQGTISNVESNAYLTNYRHVSEDEITSDDKSIITSDDVSTSNSGSYSDTGSETITYGKTNTINTTENQNKTHGLNTTEQYIESVIGNNGTYNFSRLLNDFRDTFLNIDLMVINEFKDLFFKLW